MKMIYREGDIFSENKSGHELIVCVQASRQGIIDAELSCKIRSLFPTVYETYKRCCEKAVDSRTLLGKTLFCGENHNGYDFNIALLFTQDRYEPNRFITDCDALRKALSVVREVASPLPARVLTTVRIPYKMGCDMTDESWNIVFQIIKAELGEHDIPVEIWNQKTTGK